MGLTINQLFNVNDYLTQYPDVVEAIRVGFVADALDHFTRFGAAEGRSPSRFFDSQLYLTLYSDVQTTISQGSASHALDHYLRIGQTQNRQPIAFFDSNYYLQKYPDVAEAIRTGFVTSAYEHFFIYGQTENRAPSALFNANFYLAQYPDVQAAIADGFVRNPFEHFAKYGQREGRTPSELFNPSFYLAQYPDVAEAIRTGFVGSVYHHFVLYGQKENRNPSENFNSSFYLSQYPDVAAAIQAGFVISAFDHYARFGQTEGRLPVSPTGIIRGLQWNDINGDSLLNAGEPGLAGWTIFLDQNQNGQQDTGELATITDTNGNYTFDGLAAGVYTVVAVPQDGWTETYPGASTTQTINLQAGQTIENVNFAVNALPIIEANTGLRVDEGGSFTIGVNELRVTDADNSATQLVYTLTDLPDHGTLQVDGVDLAVNQTFTQADIDSDRLSYVHDDSDTTSDSFTFIVTDAAGNTVSSDFQIDVTPVDEPPEPGSAIIRGKKWQDKNGDGIQNNDEAGLAGWTIYLDQNQNNQLDDGELSTTTDTNGDYSFVALAAGAYTVAEILQTGWRQTFPSTRSSDQSLLIPIANYNDLIFDSKRNYLYITTDDGDLERFDVATRTLLTPFDVGSSLVGGDITADGSAVYVAEGQQGATQGFIRKVNLNDGTVTNLTFDLNYDDRPSDVAIASNGLGIVRSFGQWGPLRQLDLSTDTITPGTNMWSYYGGAQITRSADRSLLFITQDGISSGPISTYDAVTNQFSPEKWTNAYLGSNLSAVNRNGSLIALEWGNGVSILDKNLAAVETLSGVDSGVAFDPVRDILYAASSATDEIIAFNTQTWKELYRLDIGEDIAPDYYGNNSVPYGTGMMAVSGDGQFLFMSTASGVRMLNLGRPGTYTVSLSSDQTVQNIDFAANSIPTISVNQGLTLNEGDTVTLTPNRLQITDPDNSADQLIYTLQEAPTYGTLKLGGAALNANQIFSQADIDSGRVSYQHNGNPVISDRFSFSVADAAGNTLDDNSFEISVNLVNDAPVIINNTGRIARAGQTVTLSNFSLLVTDEETPATQIVYTLNQLPTDGTLKLNNIALSTGQTFTQDDINNGRLSYQNTGAEASSDRFEFSATDGTTTLNSSFELEVLVGGGSPTIVRDINPGAGSSSPYGLTNVNGTLYFVASDGTVGGLWKSDGTATGTTLVKSFQSGWFSPSLSNLRNINGTLYFTTSDGNSGTELWKSDGTAVGTVLIKDIYPGFMSASPMGLTNFNGTLYFTADDGTHGVELWKSDGTAAGTTLVKDINPGFDKSLASRFTNVNGTLYFSAFDSTNGFELWKSDGTAAGTTLVKDINPGKESSLLTNFVGGSNTLYFTAYTPSTGTELWKSDGTAAGTTLVKDINPGAGGSGPDDLTNVNGTLYFTVSDGTSGLELWKSDGTAAGTTLVKDINPGAGGSTPDTLTNVNGTLYFTAVDSMNGLELWKSDGTAAGTTLVKDINPGAGGSNAANFVDVDGILYFTANNGSEGLELWRSDGTTAGTTLVQDIFGGPEGAFPGSLTNVNGTLYFVAQDGINGRELWAL